MDNFTVSQGGAITVDVILRDDNGNVITSYDGSQALVTTVWPGGARASLFNPLTTWTNPAQGTLAITITNAETTAMTPGRYQLLTRLNDAGSWVDAYEATLTITGFAGVGVAEKAYITYEDLTTYGRSWLGELQSDADESGFSEQIERATAWVDDLAQKHWPSGGVALVSNDIYGGPSISGARSVWLQQILDTVPSPIMMTADLREAISKKALAYICESQVGVGESAVGYAKLARMYHSQSDYLATCLVIQIDSDNDGFSDLTIDCSCTRPLHG